ncbi:MAG: hypothetical protein PVG61_03920 [Dehalococcoidia bacterium]
MIRLEAKTKLSPEKTIEEAVSFFGPGGYGLEVKENMADHAFFVGGGGSVTVTVKPEDKKTSVDIVSREWDFQVQQFLEKIT